MQYMQVRMSGRTALIESSRIYAMAWYLACAPQIRLFHRHRSLAAAVQACVRRIWGRKDFLGFLGALRVDCLLYIGYFRSCLASPLAKKNLYDQKKDILPKKLHTGPSLGSEDMPILFSIQNCIGQAMNPDSAFCKHFEALNA